VLLELLRAHLRPYRHWLAAVVSLQFVGTVAALYLPSLNADIIDNGVATGDTGYIVRLGAVMLAVSLVQVVASVAAVWFGARTAMAFGRVVIAVLGGLRVANGSMTIGEVQAFIQYTRQFTQPLTQVASMVNLLQSGVASAERVFALLDAEEEVPDVRAPVGSTRPDALDRRSVGEAVFERVSFSYDPERPLIEDLSLVARPGQTVAIVGPTGAGKTTLVNLVMRFYELDAGRITLDGADITAMPRAELRGRIGMVLRDRFVHSLPDGYDTVVDEDGGNLSAGERQLLTIARAFLSDPALLILDEATSSVDTRTELLVQHAMAALRTDRTSFVIAHRLSTIRDADLILVMEDGAIVEQGTHASLLTADGAYAALYRSQFAAAVAGEGAA
jgi:ATP-binding cassette subfamily B multidrug efflux pump